MPDLIFALLSGVVGSLIIAVIPQVRNRLRNFAVLFFCAAGTFFSWRVAIAVFAGESAEISGEIGGFPFVLSPDPLGAVFGLIASTLWLFAAVYSFGYMAGKNRQRSYFTFFLLALSATLGVAFSGNLIALYLFYELLTFATYPLVIHERSAEAMKAGKRYILYSLSGAGAILIAIVVTYSLTGNVDFSGEPILAGHRSSGLNFLLILFIIGFGVKAAIMPLHRWLPAAMVAPTPVSALLHAVAVVYSGAYGILRVVYSVFGQELMRTLSFRYIFSWVIAFTILAGVIIATRQDIMKLRLAYQTVSHLSYILLGAFTLQPWGLAGAVMHMISYSMLKITLFFCAGIISEHSGKTRVSSMGGIGRQFPETMAAFGVATLGMIGMLPLNTFWGKYYLMKGSVAAGMWPFALVLTGSGIINAVCFIPVVVNAFRGEKAHTNSGQKTGVALMLAPTLILVVIALFTGLWPGMVWPAVQAVVNWYF
ncbi:MAG: monovalent cation/H+ antiporter subunit D family protein [Clostridiaceae bacterium]|nr:monovalent cation/H+ antiporter subunit D family protein [Clostridiaceae bacterium]